MTGRADTAPVVAPEVAICVATMRAAPRWWSLSLKAARRQPEMAAGAVLLAAIALLSLGAPLFTSRDPLALDLPDRLAPLSAAHPFGTDELGRDLFARVLYGGRVSLGVGVSSAALSAVFGTAIGLAAAVGRRLDMVVMRAMDGLMSIPPILLAIALMAVAGASVQNVVLAVAVVETPRVARLIRGAILSLREQPFVEAAVAAGSSTPKILMRHLLPSVVAPLVVQATFVWAAAMIIESALSFIGAGAPPSTPSWGNIMAEGKALWQIRPNLIFIPAAFLSLSLLAVNLLGEGLRRALNPRGGAAR